MDDQTLILIGVKCGYFFLADMFQEELLDEKAIACANRSIFKFEFHYHADNGHGSPASKC
ncbi:hypothetical protein IFVP22_C150070 [Vibrio parahaemolyticus]